MELSTTHVEREESLQVVFQMPIVPRQPHRVHEPAPSAPHPAHPHRHHHYHSTPRELPVSIPLALLRPSVEEEEEEEVGERGEMAAAPEHRHHKHKKHKKHKKHRHSSQEAVAVETHAAPPFPVESTPRPLLLPVPTGAQEHVPMTTTIPAERHSHKHKHRKHHHRKMHFSGVDASGGLEGIGAEMTERGASEKRHEPQTLWPASEAKRDSEEAKRDSEPRYEAQTLWPSSESKQVVSETGREPQAVWPGIEVKRSHHLGGKPAFGPLGTAPTELPETVQERQRRSVDDTERPRGQETWPQALESLGRREERGEEGGHRHHKKKKKHKHKHRLSTEHTSLTAPHVPRPITDHPPLLTSELSHKPLPPSNQHEPPKLLPPSPKRVKFESLPPQAEPEGQAQAAHPSQEQRRSQIALKALPSSITSATATPPTVPSPQDQTPSPPPAPKTEVPAHLSSTPVAPKVPQGLRFVSSVGRGGASVLCLSFCSEAL